MTLSPGEVESAVRHYLSLVAAGDAEAIASLFASDAVLEDPVGSGSRSGAAIREFYGQFAGLPTETELLAIRCSGGEAAFHFRIRSQTPTGTVTVEPLEAMAFDDDGKIVSMRAWWNGNDMSVE